MEYDFLTKQNSTRNPDRPSGAGRPKPTETGETAELVVAHLTS